MSDGPRGEDPPPRGTSEKPLPRDDDAERALLAAVLIDGEKCLGVLRGVVEKFCPKSPNAIIAETIIRLADEGTAVDLVTLKSELKRRDQLRAIGDVAYLVKLSQSCLKSANAASYAARIESKARFRHSLQTWGEIGDTLQNGHEPQKLRTLYERLGREMLPKAAKLESEDLPEILSRPAPETPWAVADLLAEGDVGIISGPGGIGKSWLALHVSLALASGQAVFAHYDVKRKYRVAFLDLESRPWEVDQRIVRVAGGLGITSELIGDRVQIFRERLRLDHSTAVSRLIEQLRQWGTEFLFVDSWRRTHGKSDNDAENVSALFQTAYDRIRAETGCGTILTDHVRKQTGEKSLDSPDQSLTGSVDKRNMVDFHAGLRESTTNRLTFHPTKTRHSRKPEPVVIEMTGLDNDDPAAPVFFTFVRDADPTSDHCQDEIVALLEQKSPMPRGEILGRSKFSEKSVGRALSSLHRRKTITKEKLGKVAIYSLAEAGEENDGHDGQ